MSAAALNQALSDSMTGSGVCVFVCISSWVKIDTLCPTSHRSDDLTSDPPSPYREGLKSKRNDHRTRRSSGSNNSVTRDEANILNRTEQTPHRLAYLVRQRPCAHIIFKTEHKGRLNVWSQSVCTEIIIDAHTDIYIAEWRMSEILLRSHIPRSHTQLGCCFAGRLGDGGEWERDGGEEGGGNGEGSVSFSFIRSHTHWQPFSMFASKPWKHENLDLSTQLLSLIPSCCRDRGQSLFVK